MRDNGIGIEAQFLPHVFEVFAQGYRGLDRSQGGLGVGLAVVRRLVELHQGEVTLASDGPGLGTEVNVRCLVSARSFHVSESNRSRRRRTAPSAFSSWTTTPTPRSRLRC